MHETSLMAYAELVRDGRITKQQLLAWTVLQMHGPLTGREVEHHAEHPGLWKRLSELAKLGLVKVGPARRCAITDNWSVTWAITRPPDEAVLRDAAGRKTRARRRYWLVGADYSGIIPEGEIAPLVGDDGIIWSVHTTKEDADYVASNSYRKAEVIEVREVMRGPVDKPSQEG